jgi:hypothetical protein
MLAPRDDEILLLQIVLREGQRAAPLSMLNHPPFESRHMPRLATACIRSPESGVRGRYNRACVRVISISSARGESSDDNSLWLPYHRRQ